MDAVRADPDDGAVLFAAGVFYYFTTEEVKALVTGIANASPEGGWPLTRPGKWPSG